MILAKVISLKQPVKIHHCELFGDVAAYYVKSLAVCVWYTVQSETAVCMVHCAE